MTMNSHVVNIVKPKVDRFKGEEILKAWGTKKKTTLRIISSASLYYPFYYGEKNISIKRIPPFKPREIKHRWLIDAVTSRPFRLPEAPPYQEETIKESAEILEPVIIEEAVLKKMQQQSLRFIMRFYKYFFTPDVTLSSFNLLYMTLWIFRYQDLLEEDSEDRFIGVNSFSGNIIELEEGYS